MPDLQTTLEQRSKTHGEYSIQAGVAQRLKADMADSPNWEGLSSVQRESLEMIAHKIARILVGDPNHGDSWHDIAGYAKLVEDRLL